MTAALLHVTNWWALGELLVLFVVACALALGLIVRFLVTRVPLRWRSAVGRFIARRLWP